MDGNQLPTIPLGEMLFKLNEVSFSHSEIALKSGCKLGTISIDNVVELAHCPAVGIKVYSVVCKLFNAGDQVPEIPLVETVGKADKVCPLQIGLTEVKVGVIAGLTVIVKVVELAHCPAVGKKVYSVVCKLFNAGDQVPEIPLVEIVGKADNVCPLQIGLTEVKVGVIAGFMVIVKLVGLAHCPAVGVKI